MILLIVLLILIILALLFYLYLIKRQIKKMDQRLRKRLTSDSHQYISIDLINKQMEQLASTMNKCLKAEEDLRLKAVREENEFKDLIANISHDLRTPLTAVKGYLQLLERTPLSKDQADKLFIARKHAEELGRLIEHFFEYSYYLNTPPIALTEEIKITNLLMDCLAEAIPMFEAKGLQLRIGEQEQVTVVADKELTTRIIQNLIRNCLMHAKGQVYVSIKKLYDGNDTCKIHFINPIENEKEMDVTRIFERFYSSDQARRKSTGLGLTIAKVLVEKMGGHVGASIQDKELDIWFSL